MKTQHREIERKYEVDAATPVPDLAGLPAVASVDQSVHSTLEAVYFDTDGQALANARITLRRRTGGKDAGWHLKLPEGGDDRTEIGVPLGKDAEHVPGELSSQIAAWVRGRELRPVASLSTERVSHRLLAADGRPLAEITDDHVTAQATPRHGEAVLSTWREWEIELVEGPRKLLTAAGGLFVGAGATPSAWPSKLHHALGLPASEPAPDRSALTGKSAAGTVLKAYLTEQVRQIEQRDSGVRRNEADAVHKMRVATRRLRSALSTFRPLLDATITDPLREELKWLAGALGAARDAQVQRMHLESAVADEPGELVLGPIAARVELELRSDYRTAHDALLTALDSTRYFTLLEHLDALVAAPPWTELADLKAKAVLRKRVRHTARRLYRLASQAEPVDGVARDVWLHEVRKAAKRVRYAAEAAEPALGDPATRLAGAAESLQETLGDHQDSVVIRETLRAIGVRMHLDGENAFTIGRLHALQQTRADAAQLAFHRMWADGFGEQLQKWPSGG